MGIGPGILILSLRFWMYRVSETCSSSGTGVVSRSAGGASTGCCSGCGGAVDMVEVVGTQRSYNHRSFEQSLSQTRHMLPL